MNGDYFNLSLQKKMNSKNPRQRSALRQIVDYTVGALVAGLLMMWGTMNFVTNLTELNNSAAGQNWWLATVFGLFTILLPFGLGVWLISRQMKMSGTKKAANRD